MLDGEPQFGLGTLVTGGGVLSTLQVESDLGLFRKLLGKVLEQLVVSGIPLKIAIDVPSCQILVHRVYRLVPWQEPSIHHRQPK